MLSLNARTWQARVKVWTNLILEDRNTRFQSYTIFSTYHRTLYARSPNQPPAPITISATHSPFRTLLMHVAVALLASAANGRFFTARFGLPSSARGDG